MNDPVDIGTAVARAMLDAALATAKTRGLGGDDLPDYVVHATGQQLPTADACDGILWARVGSAYPTNGTGVQYTSARPSWEIPAWAFPIEVGALFCHTNITEDGGWITDEAEGVFAARDGAWRSAILEAVGYTWRPAPPDPLAVAVLGQVVNPWAPIGPDGGYSGGLLTATVIVGGLWLC